MIQSHNTSKNLIGRWCGCLLLGLALALTIAGVMRWSILVYGAAACYFCVIVLFVNGRSSGQSRRVEFTPGENCGWF